MNPRYYATAFVAITSILAISIILYFCNPKPLTRQQKYDRAVKAYIEARNELCTQGVMMACEAEKEYTEKECEDIAGDLCKEGPAEDQEDQEDGT